MVEIYRTNIHSESDASLVKDELMRHFPESVFHIDLEDCDRILKATGHTQHIEQVPDKLKQLGFLCSPLED